MNEKTLFDLLRTILVGTQPIPVAYDHFKEYPDNKVVPPFILYRNTDTTTIKADDMVHAKFNNYIVDLVTISKNVVLEEQLESLFNSSHLPYDKEEDYLSDEQIFQIRYFI